MRKGIHKNSGFTLVELMISIALLALLATIAIPNMIGWRSGAKLRGAVENLRGDLQLAKLRAVQENGFVTVLFFEDSNEYCLFIDDGDETPVDWPLEAGEIRFRIRSIPTGVSIDADFNGYDYVRFNNRGLPENTGNVLVVSSDGDGQTIELNRLGLINIQ